MNLFAAYTEKILLVLKDLLAPDVDLSRVTVDPPREAAHGDMACNAAMVLAKPTGQAPRKLAETLVPLLKKSLELRTSPLRDLDFSISRSTLTSGRHT